MTLDTWFNIKSFTNYNWLIGRGTTGARTDYSIGVQNSTTLMYMFDDSGAPTFKTVTVSALNTNQWYHLVVTLDSSNNAVFYLNGASAGTATSATHIDQSGATPLLQMGRGYNTDNGSAVYANSLIDDVRISGTARTADWVKAEYLTATDSMNTFGAEETNWWDSTYLNRSKVTLTNSNMLFSDNFEANNLVKWNTTTGAVTVDTAHANGSVYAAKVNPSAAITNSVVSITSNASASAVGYFYATAQPAANANMMTLYNATTGAAGSEVTVTRHAGDGYLCVTAGAIAARCTTTAFPLNQWNKIEINATASTTVGRYNLILNGTSILAGANINTGAAAFDSFDIGDYASSTQTFWVDDVAVFATPIAGDLANFPVQVKLTASRINYSAIHLHGASPDYPNDIRFVYTGTTALKYEIESCNYSASNSAVWVKVPTVPAGDGSLSKSIYLYYNNASASDAQDGANVWIVIIWQSGT